MHSPFFIAGCNELVKYVHDATTSKYQVFIIIIIIDYVMITSFHQIDTTRLCSFYISIVSLLLIQKFMSFLSDHYSTVAPPLRVLVKNPNDEILFDLERFGSNPTKKKTSVCVHKNLNIQTISHLVHFLCCALQKNMCSFFVCINYTINYG